jgi:hypothetical protein
VSPNKTDVDHSIRVIDLHNQAVLIAANIEHYTAPLQDTGISVLGFNICGRGPVSLGYLSVLIFQRFFSVGKPPILLPELPQGALGNNPYATTLLNSQFGNKQVD